MPEAEPQPLDVNFWEADEEFQPGSDHEDLVGDALAEEARAVQFRQQQRAAAPEPVNAQEEVPLIRQLAKLLGQDGRCHRVVELMEKFNLRNEAWLKARMQMT